MSDEYDHRKNSGNRGDVVKHPALMAALGTLLATRDAAEDFVLADTFAGFAYYPQGEGWRQGVGRLRTRVHGPTTLSSPYLAEWFAWYVLAQRPGGSGPNLSYPGSTVIALDLAEHIGRKLRVAAWDTFGPAFVSLKAMLGGRDGDHSVFQHEARVDDPDITAAGFLFIDPPRQKDWTTVRRFLVLPCPNVLVWLPLSPGGGPSGESGNAREARDWARRASIS
jgi:23S rRNA A2030 N6-methylase RlmJ